MRVATDVDAHSTRVQQISDELTCTTTAGTDVVIQTIARLVEVNQDMQQRLAEAEVKLQEQSEQLEVQIAAARTDMLTRLPNRRAFEDEAARRFAEFQRHGTPLSAILLDVDRFKRFNDEYGHRVGDEVLRGIAAVLRQTMRAIDLVARYGGEEFTILLPGTAIQDARQAAERCRQAIEKARVCFEGEEFSVTVSLGVAELLPHEQLSLLMRRVDGALYASKQAGRNQTHWHDGRVIHPVVTQSSGQTPPQQPADQPPEPQPAPVAEAPRSKPAPAAPPEVGEPAAETTGNGSDELAAHECDRTVFCWQVRQRIAEWKRGGPGFSVILVRVDDFDPLTKTHGRSAAEFALRTTRLFLAGTLREMDVVGHYSSGCFSVLLPHTRLREAVSVAERVRHGATQCVLPTRHGAMEITISVGIAELSEGDDVVRLLQRAEAALTSAEKNRTCFHNGQGPESVEPDPKASTSSAASVLASSAGS